MTRPIKPSRWSWLVLGLLMFAAWSLCGCGRGNAETWTTLPYPVAVRATGHVVFVPEPLP